MIPLWLLGKFVFYCCMIAVAIWWFGFRARSPGVDILKVFGFGALRMALGLLGGPLILVVASWLPHTLPKEISYLISFGGVRYLEWSIILAIMAWSQSSSPSRTGWRGQVWVLVGVAGNIAFDQLAILLKFENEIFISC